MQYSLRFIDVTKRGFYVLLRSGSAALRGNKIITIKVIKNLLFGVDFKLYVPPLMCEINVLNISDVSN